MQGPIDEAFGKECVDVAKKTNIWRRKIKNINDMEDEGDDLKVTSLLRELKMHEAEQETFISVEDYVQAYQVNERHAVLAFGRSF